MSALILLRVRRHALAPASLLLALLAFGSCATYPATTAPIDAALAEPLAQDIATQSTEPPPPAPPSSRIRGYENSSDFLGPSATEAQLETDAKEKESVFRFDSLKRQLKPYFDWKSRLAEDHGFTIGADYTAAIFDASAGPGETTAAGAVFRLFGAWKLLEREEAANGGSLVWKVENRHALGTDATPSNLGFQIGYAGLIGPIYSDPRWQLTNLYWKQSWSEGQTNVVAGIVDSTDYLNIYALINPWTAFSNLTFLFDATIPGPNQGLGAAFGTMLSDTTYLVGGITDANGDPTRPEDMLSSFFDEAEFFTHVELGLVDSFDRRYFDNTHVTLWHADEREQASTADGWGAAFSFTRFVDDRWMPFLRAGYAKDGGSVLETSLAAGLGYYRANSRDLFGLGLAVGQPNESTFAPDLEEQYTAELFYRIQLSEAFAVTPDVQFIVNPALNQDEDQIVVLGLRGRLAL